jgi:hypothetical protein
VPPPAESFASLSSVLTYEGLQRSAQSHAGLAPLFLKKNIISLYFLKQIIYLSLNNIMKIIHDIHINLKNLNVILDVNRLKSNQVHKLN